MPAVSTAFFLSCDDVIHDSCPFHDRMVNGSKILPLESFDPEEGTTFKGRHLLTFAMPRISARALIKFLNF